MLGGLTQRAVYYTLPFVRDGTFGRFTETQVQSEMTAAFGTEAFPSLTNSAYNTKASTMNLQHNNRKISL